MVQAVISVVVPYRTDGGHRDRAWAFNRERWAFCFPHGGVEVLEATDDGGEHPGHFNHPRAINRAAERAQGDVLIVADADTTFDPAWVHEAAELVGHDLAPWVLPRFYDQLTEASTERVLAQAADAPIAGYDIEWRGDSVCWSGLVVVPRRGFDAVGGYDERWEFWGGDDIAFGCSMNALWGPVTRLEGAAMHLWHPRTHLDAQPVGQDKLMRRYMAAAEDAEAMRALIAERGGR